MLNFDWRVRHGLFFFASAASSVTKGVTMMTKLYYAYVAVDVVDYFEKMLDERKDKIKVIDFRPAVSEDGKPVIKCTLEAEEGMINSKWELK